MAEDRGEAYFYKVMTKVELTDAIYYEVNTGPKPEGEINQEL